jgi:DNA end-binding protein Ku
MAARSIASLTISFGLVSIPVKLYSATESERAISFNMLHKTCGSRLKQQYLCIKEEIPVAREEMVKGYEFAKDQYVMFTPEEIKALEEPEPRGHVPRVVRPSPSTVYFDKAYYLSRQAAQTSRAARELASRAAARCRWRRKRQAADRMIRSSRTARCSNCLPVEAGR